MILIKISAKIIEDSLTEGFVTNHIVKVIEGLPKGCKLIHAQFDRNDDVVRLMFAEPDEEYKEKNIILETQTKGSSS